MDNSDLVQIADAIAVEAHRGQTDKLGVDYFEHPRAVPRRRTTEWADWSW